jgi:hypothetical protein
MEAEGSLPPFPSMRLCVKFRNMLVFTVEFSVPSPKSEAGGPPTVGYPQLPI